MATTIDARGLSCPQPVLITLKTIDEANPKELLVLVDTEASKENVSRAVAGKGWIVAGITEQGDEYHLKFVKD